MKQIQLSADVRTTLKKNAMNRLRAEKKIPAVLYGQGESAVNLQLDDKDIFHAFHSSSATNVLIKLNIKGAKEETVMVKDMQRHPVTSKLMHIDFVKVSMDKPLETNIPVVVTGTARGIKEGGMLELVHRELNIRCLPALLPENVTVDVTELSIGGAVTVGDLKLADGIEVLVDSHEPVVHVVAPRVEETKAEGAVGAAADAPKQPEVIGEKEREERRAEKDKK